MPRRRPRKQDKKAIPSRIHFAQHEATTALVLSGGGARAAYQVGALKALLPYFQRSGHCPNIVVGSSIGAINGLVLSACAHEGFPYAVAQLEELWRERTFRNTFAGSPSGAFFRAIRMATLQYLSPGPNPTSDSIFDPTPLMERVDGVLAEHGGISPDTMLEELMSVAVMTTVEGPERKPLLFLSSHHEVAPEMMEGASFRICNVDSLTAKHGFASAALPSVLPPVQIDTQHESITLVDGGISQNVPVDPAVRLGAERVIIIDVSGRDWWLTKYGEAHDTRPDWEVPAGHETFCLRPPDTCVLRCQQPLGPLLKESVTKSTRKFMKAVGPIWPLYTLLKRKLGEDVAYETMSYVALDPDYIRRLIERGYNETTHRLRNREEPRFHTNENFEEVVQAVCE